MLLKAHLCFRFKLLALLPALFVEHIQFGLGLSMPLPASFFVGGVLGLLLLDLCLGHHMFVTSKLCTGSIRL